MGPLTHEQPSSRVQLSQQAPPAMVQVFLQDRTGLQFRHIRRQLSRVASEVWTAARRAQRAQFSRAVLQTCRLRGQQFKKNGQLATVAVLYSLNKNGFCHGGCQVLSGDPLRAGDADIQAEEVAGAREMNKIAAGPAACAFQT